MAAPGQGDEARELLALIYGWFTEGFDTADLQTTKVLLEAHGPAGVSLLPPPVMTTFKYGFDRAR